MMEMTRSRLAAGVLAGVLALLGCEGRSRMYDPHYWHTGFVTGLQKNVGMKFEAVKGGLTGGWARESNLDRKLLLPNGNIAYKYRYQGTCRYIFEVDPKTDIIVAATWEGEVRHCAIVP